jgi:Zinc carboxypeptidase
MSQNRKPAGILLSNWLAIACWAILYGMQVLGDDSSQGDIAQIKLKNAAIILWQLQSSNDSVQQTAISQVKYLASEKPWDLDSILPQIFSVLVDTKKYDDTLAIASDLIQSTPYTEVRIEFAQRARAQVYIAEGKYDQALQEAKCYYNVCSLVRTADAIGLLAQIFKHQTVNDPTIVMQFMDQQARGIIPSSSSVNQKTDINPLSSIKVDPELYDAALRRHSVEKDSYRTLIGSGNLLLLKDRPQEAKKAFAAAWAYSGNGPVRTQGVIEGIARAIRDERGAVQPANQFVLDVRQGSDSEVNILLPQVDPVELAKAAETIRTAVIPIAAAPPLEQGRQAKEASSKEASDIRIETNFECSTPAEVEQISSTHWKVSLTSPLLCDWFMFKVNNVRGKTIRIDVSNPNSSLDNWWTIDPVFTCDSLDDMNSFKTTRDHFPLIHAWNGPQVPAAAHDAWHYITNTWMEEAHTLSFVQTFDRNQACIAMRVPYTPSYNEKYLTTISSIPFVKVHTIGQSVQNRALQLVQIGDGGSQAEQNKPCALIYAREHADEPDSSWAAKGTIDFLIGDDPDAKELRKRATFLIIPVLDPDGAAASVHDYMTSAFMDGHTTPESVAYANWMRAWVRAGNRLDVVIDFHNLQSREGPQVSCPILESDGDRGASCLALHEAIVEKLKTNDFLVDAKPWMFGASPERFGGWLAKCFGPLTLVYEINSQDPTRHLSINELQNIGKLCANTIGDFLQTPAGGKALVSVDARRREWLVETKQYVSAQVDANHSAIGQESHRSKSIINGASADGNLMH